jgi:hypothetical protein
MALSGSVKMDNKKENSILKLLIRSWTIRHPHIEITYQRKLIPRYSLGGLKSSILLLKSKESSPMLME